MPRGMKELYNVYVNHGGSGKNFSITTMKDVNAVSINSNLI